MPTTSMAPCRGSIRRPTGRRRCSQSATGRAVSPSRRTARPFGSAARSRHPVADRRRQGGRRCLQRFVAGADPDERRARRVQARWRQRRHATCARSGHVDPEPDRRRYDVHLPAAVRDPLLERGARAASRLPPRDRALRGGPRERRRHGLLLLEHRRLCRVPEGADALQPLEGDRDRLGLEYGHLPPGCSRPRLPAQARTSRCLRRAGGYAVEGLAAAAGDRPLYVGKLRRETRRPACPQPTLPGVESSCPTGRLPGRARLAVQRLAGCPTPCRWAREGRCRGRRWHAKSGAVPAPCASTHIAGAVREPIEGQPADYYVLRLPQHPGRPLQRREGATCDQLRRRPQPHGRPPRRAGAPAAELPGAAAEHRRLPTPLPLHDRPEPRREVHGP